jgi:hypothetical protein
MDASAYGRVQLPACLLSSVLAAWLPADCAVTECVDMHAAGTLMLHWLLRLLLMAGAACTWW